MNSFKLRLPTIRDVEFIWNSLLEKHSLDEVRNILHWGYSGIKYPDNHGRFFGEFFLSDEVPYHSGFRICAGLRDPGDRYASTGTAPAAFRPVLEAWGHTDLSCIADGTIINMGAFMLGGQQLPFPGRNEVPPIWPARNSQGGPLLVLNPYAEGEKESISWIKFGNILMADRCILSKITFQQLEEQRMTTGVALKMPFDKIVARMFYDQALQQPRSKQREIGEMMHEFYASMGGNSVPAPDPDLLYTLAKKAHAYWLSPDSEPLTMEEIVEAVVELMEQGVDGLPGREQDSKTYYFESFSREAAKQVLQYCNYAVFAALVDHKAKDNLMSQLAGSPNPAISPAGQALFALRNVEKDLSNRLSLADKINNAEARKSPKDSEQSSHLRECQERES